jgi:hypothetical protein
MNDTVSLSEHISVRRIAICATWAVISGLVIAAMTCRVLSP